MRTRSSRSVPPRRSNALTQLRRAASWHRRKLAVVAAVAAVLTGLAATAPPLPPTTSVVRARAALAGGVVLTADDLEVVALPTEGLPDRSDVGLDDLVGRRLAGPVPRRQVLTTDALASVDTAVGVGHVLAPVRLADADVVALLRPGDVVDVIGSAADGGATRTVARSVRVVTVPARDPDDQGTSTGALVVLDVVDTDAEPLARAAATGGLTVVWP